MERVGILIDKLKEQFEHQAGSDELLVTVKNLYAAIQASRQAELPFQASIPPSMQEPRPAQTPVAPIVSEVPKAPEAPMERPVRELNDAMSVAHKNLNDLHRNNQQEMAETFREVPIRDLKNAIGINDRYLFINELFRGDETMFERSLKTINSFSIFPEAQYWIQRELKVKLGWKDRSDIVEHFDQLVKRRFAAI